jgi:hypothetical protein
LITKTFPRRRTTTDPGLRFSDLIELRTFMADSFRPEALKLDTMLNTISIVIIPRLLAAEHVGDARSGADQMQGQGAGG